MTGEHPDGLTTHNMVRGRPRTDGAIICSRCGHGTPRARITWPEGRICGACYTRATHTHGRCPTCGQVRLLPGPPDSPGGPACGDCAGIPTDFHCPRCHAEGAFYRHGTCARCCLRDDLVALLLRDTTADPPAVEKLIDTLCAARRPESILTWKRSSKVQGLLTSLATGSTPMTHAGLDAHGERREADHLRAILVQAGLLPQRDLYLAHFEQWSPARPPAFLPRFSVQ